MGLRSCLTPGNQFERLGARLPTAGIRTPGSREPTPLMGSSGSGELDVNDRPQLARKDPSILTYPRGFPDSSLIGLRGWITSGAVESNVRRSNEDVHPGQRPIAPSGLGTCGRSWCAHSLLRRTAPGHAHHRDDATRLLGRVFSRGEVGSGGQARHTVVAQLCSVLIASVEARGWRSRASAPARLRPALWRGEHRANE